MEHNDHDLLIRLDEKLDDLIRRFVAHDALEVKNRENDDRRLSSLEQWRWRWAGVVSVGLVIISVCMNLATHYLLR